MLEETKQKLAHIVVKPRADPGERYGGTTRQSKQRTLYIRTVPGILRREPNQAAGIAGVNSYFETINKHT